MRRRVAGLVEINNGYALMHRKNVKKKKIQANHMENIMCFQVVD